MHAVFLLPAEDALRTRVTFQRGRMLSVAAVCAEDASRNSWCACSPHKLIDGDTVGQVTSGPALRVKGINSLCLLVLCFFLSTIFYNAYFLSIPFAGQNHTA